ncbi:MAG: hypothetical protein LBF97_07845 [Elusimicrobiota bacterium]|jgi:hypothetical protein|nr:hypothetical protein [Elusimicrobiota bacterium]
MTIEKLRDDLDNILTFIKEATLNNEEFENCQKYFLDLDNITLEQKYNALFQVLKTRTNQGNAIQKLDCYFYIQGLSRDDMKLEYNYNNIMMGVVVE